MTNDDRIQTALAVLAEHRWESIGVDTVRCECGEVLAGDATLTAFPADQAFRRHLAAEILAAVDREPNPNG